jgi:hypothetical protein
MAIFTQFYRIRLAELDCLWYTLQYCLQRIFDAGMTRKELEGNCPAVMEVLFRYLCKGTESVSYKNWRLRQNLSRVCTGHSTSNNRNITAAPTRSVRN